ncbi:MAG TPA: hypothetical protein VL551_11710 [Actinospica sp.]|jgi:hypothetical protein|nr:hypothetical protein [Actinospica sp.]
MTAFPPPEAERPHADRIPEGAARLDALHNIGTAEGIHVWHYEPGHPMTVVFTTVIDPGDLADEVLCEQVFALLNIGHHPAEVGLSAAPDQRAVDYRERGNRSLSVGDTVAVTRGAQTVYYKVAMIGFTQIDAPSIVNRPGYGTVPLA